MAQGAGSRELKSPIGLKHILSFAAVGRLRSAVDFIGAGPSPPKEKMLYFVIRIVQKGASILRSSVTAKDKKACPEDLLD